MTMIGPFPHTVVAHQIRTAKRVLYLDKLRRARIDPVTLTIVGGIISVGGSILQAKDNAAMRNAIQENNALLHLIDQKCDLILQDLKQLRIDMDEAIEKGFRNGALRALMGIMDSIHQQLISVSNPDNISGDTKTFLTRYYGDLSNQTNEIRRYGYAIYAIVAEAGMMLLQLLRYLKIKHPTGEAVYLSLKQYFADGRKLVPGLYPRTVMNSREDARREEDTLWNQIVSFPRAGYLGYNPSEEDYGAGHENWYFILSDPPGGAIQGRTGFQFSGRFESASESSFNARGYFNYKSIVPTINDHVGGLNGAIDEGSKVVAAINPVCTARDRAYEQMLQLDQVLQDLQRAEAAMDDFWKVIGPHLPK
jgi:hypothetical protein